jgi:osmotically-inducible protein OsmY
MIRTNKTPSKLAARGAIALAVAALAAPFGAAAANDTSSQSSPSSTSPQGSMSQGSTSQGSTSGSSTKQRGSNKVSKRATSGSDQQIADRVASALSNDSSMDGAAIIVVVDDGNVALGGTTADASQSAHAIQVAQDAAGPAIVVMDELQPTALVIAPAPATR